MLSTLMAVALAATVPESLTQLDCMRGNLAGAHLRIVLIDALNFTEMNDGANTYISDSAQWTGLFPNMIKFFADQAGFTYELKSPSGTGSHCSGNVSHGVAQFAGQYNCGQDDVVETNEADVYWSMFYVTPTRSSLNLFTMAFDTNQGLVIVAKRAYTFDEYIAGQAAGTLGPVCTKDGAAFSDWLADNVPTLVQANPRISGGTDGMIAAMSAGKCDGFIDAKAYAEWLASNPAYCNSGLAVGTPLSYGVSNMAIGVNQNLPQVADALSYWVSYYRLCSTTLNTASNKCYGKTNWATLYHESNTYYTCPASNSGGGTGSVTAAFTLSGDVSDYDRSKQALIIAAIAQAAVVPTSEVHISLSSGSVKVTALVLVSDQTTASTTAASLSSGIFANAGALQTALQSQGLDDVTVGQINDPPAGTTTASSEGSGAALVTGWVLFAVVAVLLALLFYQNQQLSSKMNAAMLSEHTPKNLEIQMHKA